MLDIAPPELTFVQSLERESIFNACKLAAKEGA
jgi:hypothetical protein